MRSLHLRPLSAALLLAFALSVDAGAQLRRPTPIRFSRGATAARVLVALGPGESSREYAVHVRGGQVMNVNLTETNAPGAFSVACPGCPGAGATFRAFSTQGRWSGALPATGTYVIRVAATAPGKRLSLAVAVASAGTAAPAAHPATIRPVPPRSAHAVATNGTAPRAASPNPAGSPGTKANAAPGSAAARGVPGPAVAPPLSPAAQRAAQAGAAAAAASLAAPFRSMLPRLKQSTRVPILLPRELPGEMEAPLYAFGRGTAAGYRITIAHAPGCDAHACNAGYMDAARGRRPAGTKRVKLAGGTDAFFTPMACGASCTDPRLEWAQGGVTYGVELSLPGTDAHHQAVLARVAQSAIAAGPR